MRQAILGVAMAIAITTTMDATGYTMFSALPLIVLTGVFWAWQRLSRAEIGLRWGAWTYHGWALLHSFLVLGATFLVAAAAGALDPSGAEWGKAGLDVLLMSTTGILAILLTEEGFFRGWLWGALARTGRGDGFVLLASSVAFSLWHVSAISLDTGFDVPAAQIPVYLVNATVMGAIWGMLRMVSRSVVVASVAHAVWNGIDYPLFGFGTEVGALGIQRTAIFGPEVGVLGLALNVAFATALWLGVRRTAAATG